MAWDLARSEALHARVLAFVAAFERGAPMPEPFDALGTDIARHQIASVPGYARLCAKHGLDATAASATALTAFPAVPTDAFKRTRVAAHPAELDALVFRTSGTTQGAEERGQHFVRDLGTYERASVAFGRACLAHDFPERVPVLVLGPSPRALPDSSLTHMLASFVREFGTAAGEADTYFVDDGVFDVNRMDARASNDIIAGHEHALILGTSYAFAEFYDAMDPDRFRLPAQTRLMQTGGFKGRTKEIPEATLRKNLAHLFFLPDEALHSEYGMTELGSQFYTQEHRGQRRYVSPPWARVQAVDPVTLAPVPLTEVGIGRIEDLVNVDSACVVLTQDRIRTFADGTFELLGRLPGAPPRGCSLTLEEMLG